MGIKILAMLHVCIALRLLKSAQFGDFEWSTLVPLKHLCKQTKVSYFGKKVNVNPLKKVQSVMVHSTGYLV